MNSLDKWENCYKETRQNSPLIWPDVQSVRLLAQAQLDAKSNVLEIACGEGRNTRLLLESGHNVTVIEQSKAALDIVKRLYNLPTKNMICDDVLQGVTQLKEKKFEMIFCWGVIHFIKDPIQLLNTLSGYLTGKKKLIISFTADSDNCDRVEGINCFYSEQQARDTLNQAGFIIEQLGLQKNNNIKTGKQEAFYWALAFKVEEE